jgi:hypothetical protein
MWMPNGVGSMAGQEFSIQLGRIFQVIYEQANSSAGRRRRPPEAT